MKIQYAVLTIGLASLGMPVATHAQAAAAQSWFGIPLPPGLEEHAAPVLIGSRGPAPAVVPAGEESHEELQGAKIASYLETIVGFSKRSREVQEIGDGQLWGRITGLPSGRMTVEWAAEQFRQAGIEDVRLQTLEQTEDAALWLPLSWEVRLLGDSRFGDGSRDVVLESAMPLAPSTIASGETIAPLVYVGNATLAELDKIDVRGKIAVQQVVPQAHMVFERNPTVPRAQELMRRGAVAVFNLMRQPGNERARDFSNCGGPCFNLGGRDSHFLQRVMDEAARAGVADEVRVRIRLRAEERSGLTGRNAVAVIPGSGSDEVVVLNAHADAWFDGAGDNADGLAVLVALARHFAHPDHRPRHTLALVASAGHHTPGINGPRGFVQHNPELAERATVVVNIEHVAQRNISPARSVAADGYRDWVADSGEAPIVVGIPDGPERLNELFDEGVERYGVNFVSERSPMASGETGGFSALDATRITIMQAPPLYHTSGEVAEVISTPGLERIARFLAWFVGRL